jgi:hypothetical protein
MIIRSNMSSVLNNLKTNGKAYEVISGLDKTTLTAYTIRYCSVREDTAYLIIVSETIDVTLGSRWARAKFQCREQGIYLDVSVVTSEQYIKWVHNSVRRDPDSPEEWLQRWYKVFEKEPKDGLWAKAADHIYYLKDIRHYESIAPKILENGYFSLGR